MVYSLIPTVEEVLDLETAVDHIKGTVDFSSEESLLGAADALKGLSNNKDLLSDWLNEHLSPDLCFPDNGYSAGVTCLAVEEQFVIRANVWLPPRANTLDLDADNLAASYALPHDHNLTFLTVGYTGSGYNTDLYEYEPSQTIGYTGEYVDLTFVESTSLPEGKVMLYRESRDVHVQHHSEEFSVSLNILSFHRRYHNTQRFFDLGTGQVKRAMVDSAFSRSSFLCRMAGLIGDDATFELLQSHAWEADRDSCSRWNAIESCMRLQSDLALTILERASRDADRYVAHMAATSLAGLSDRPNVTNVPGT